MTSPRHREIKSLMDKRLYLLALGFTCFWAPLMYLWAWMLWPIDQALFPALGLGVAGMCILYPFWMSYGKKLDRLLKYSVLFGDFFEAMINDMEANDAEKGDSWLTIDEPQLRKLQNRKIHQLQDKKRTVADDFQYQKELANYCAMVYLRGMQLD